MTRRSRGAQVRRGSACWRATTAAVVLGLLPLSAAAQGPPSGTEWTAGVGVIANRDAISGLDATTRPGVTATLGVDPWRHVSVRLELDVPAYATETVTIPFGGSAFTDVTRVRVVTATPLLEVHGQLTPHIRLGALAGVAAAWQQLRITRTIRDADVPGPTTFPSTDAGVIPLVLGADVTIGVTRRLAIAISVRLGLTPPNDFGATLLKPGVTARWRF